jgi:hypothetical protein
MEARDRLPGFSYRVANFTMPRMKRPATLHVNLAKVWLFGKAEEASGVQSDTYLAGFSLTFSWRRTSKRPLIEANGRVE